MFFRTVPPAHTLVRRVNEYAFASIMQARPYPVFGRPVHPGSRLRLRPGASPHALRISPHGEHPALRWFLTTGQRDITPAFGYGAPHLSTRGTSTLLINALPGAHYGLLRLLIWLPHGFRLIGLYQSLRCLWVTDRMRSLLFHRLLSQHPALHTPESSSRLHFQVLRRFLGLRHTVTGSALSCSPFRVTISVLQVSLYVTG